MQTDACIVLCFVKHPEPGKVKTRLAASLGDREAAGLYRCMALDVLDKIRHSGLPCRVCVAPGDKAGEAGQWLGWEHEARPQHGADLGDRMRSAFEEAFDEGYTRVILVGSDLPDLPSETFNGAAIALGGHEAVLGPAGDGGYYLVGFDVDGFCPEVFDGPEWGTNRVFEHTAAILAEYGRSVYFLRKWYDVDEPGDLARLVARVVAKKSRAPRTLERLRSLPHAAVLRGPGAE
ncbi:MAG: TIGR04282 family arsenosugar biosynthesis glycosyltransferase [Desulfatibacillaceae bacterium]